MNADGYTTTDVLQATGISLSTLQVWEGRQVAWPPWKVNQRERLRYSACHILRIQAVVELRKMGIPLQRAAAAADDFVVMKWRRKQREPN